MSENVLNEICRETFEVDSFTAKPQTKVREVENWNSFAHIQFMIAIEEAFGVEFSTEEVQEVETLGELGELINARGGSFEWN